MLEELEKKRVEQEKEEYRKKVVLLFISCIVMLLSMGCLVCNWERKYSV